MPASYSCSKRLRNGLVLGVEHTVLVICNVLYRTRSTVAAVRMAVLVAAYSGSIVAGTHWCWESFTVLLYYSVGGGQYATPVKHLLCLASLEFLGSAGSVTHYF